ncbi:hypothetical protein [Streptomyces sp. NPDC002853]
MKALNVKRLLVAASMVAGVVAVPVAAAAPASATAWDCRAWVKNHGYTVGPKVTKACDAAAKGKGTPSSPFYVGKCKVALMAAGVRESIVSDACRMSAGV